VAIAGNLRATTKQLTQKTLQERQMLKEAAELRKVRYRPASAAFFPAFSS
jgi:hypothetical protein